jgi:hypothetical protein
MKFSSVAKMMWGKASKDEFEELFASMGMEAKSEPLPANGAALAAAMEPVISAALAGSGSFQRLEMKGEKGGKVTAFVIFSN